MAFSKSSNDNNSDTINITLKNANDAKSEITKVLSPGLDSTSYIIDLNQQLLSGNRELVIENNTLKKDLVKKDEELEENDDAIGRVEKSNVYLKNLLKNFLEMSKLYQEISEKRKIISDENFSAIKIFKDNVKKFRYTVISIYFIFFTISIMVTPLYIVCGFVIYSVLPITLIEYNIMEFKLPSNENNIIKNIQKQIKELDSSQDYIHEFIDQV
jgi:hypothetical protein|tara:strand:- start:1359 stop:2000 length:642 start_codon:yes stop_codon:yes gene_type:complete